MCDSGENFKKCLYCRSQISKQATVCPKCQRNQSRFRNELLFIGAIVGFLTLFVSPFTYIGKEINIAYQKIVRGDKILINSFFERDDAIIHNVGYRGINILRVEISHPIFKQNTLYEIYKTLPKDEIVRFAVGEKKRVSLIPTNSAPFNKYIKKIESFAQNGAIEDIYPIAAITHDPDYKFRKNDFSASSTPWPKEYNCEIRIVFIPLGETEEVTKKLECTSMIYSEAKMQDLLNRLQQCTKQNQASKARR